jgi:hypothetical protein
MALPRPFWYHPAAIFIPTGYIPAKKNPVRKRKKSNEARSFARKYTHRFDRAPNNAQVKKTILDENRSEMVKKAKRSVPTIKPN